ncbi:MAG: glycosyltransferase [Candidatus Helarchaeota archaeon]
MKIGFFTDTYSQINGVSITIKALERNLRDFGHEVYVYAPRGEVRENKSNPYLFTSEGLRFILSPEYRWAIFPIFTIPQSNLGLDIIHVHSPVSMGLAGLINAKRLAIPCIGSVHTLLPEFWKPFISKYLPYITPSFLNRTIKNVLKRFDQFSLVDTSIDLGTFFMEEFSWRYFTNFFKRCDRVLSPSKYAQKECLKHGLRSEVLPNGIDFQKFQTVRDLSRINKTWNLNAKDRVLLYVGRLSEEKNIELLLKATPEIAECVEHLKIMIVGDGPHRPKLERIVEKNNTKKFVIFTGYLELEALSWAYSRATLFINPSPLETQGLSVIEAMYFGCPILTINSGAVAEMVWDSEFGGVFEDRKSLIQMVCKMTNDQKLLRKFRKNAHHQAHQYDIKRFCKKLIEIYETELERIS